MAVAGCALESPSAAYPWRGQYRIDSSSCAFLDGALSLRLHEEEPGQIALYTPFLPDGWSPVDNVRLEADGDGLAGSAAVLECGVDCPTCNPGAIRYERDTIGGTPAKSIRLELMRASAAATETTCSEDGARALAPSAVRCIIDATYFAADRL
jgi:hypothetical protein